MIFKWNDEDVYYFFDNFYDIFDLINFFVGIFLGIVIFFSKEVFIEYQYVMFDNFFLIIIYKIVDWYVFFVM